jgi:cytochrome c peroxidase
MRLHRSNLSRHLSSAVAGILVTGLAGCEPPDTRVPRQLERPVPLSVLPVTVSPPLAVLPPAPETDAAKVALGGQLFHDTRLSGDGTVSCASCHALDNGGTDSPLKTSVGIGGAVGPINAPTVFNAHWQVKQFWDGRADTLEAQAAGPVENASEMGAKWEDVIVRLKGVQEYVTAFEKAYGGAPTKEHVTHAIAEYERTLATPGRFDRFGAGEVAALSDEEREGLKLFTSIGCTSCHAGPLLGGQSFEKMGTVREYFARRGGAVTDADKGRFNVTQAPADMHKFKVPTLRNVALTPPYFHDGYAETLERAVELMAHHQLGRTLTPDETKKIVAFLKALDGENLAALVAASPKPPVAAAAVAPAEGEGAPADGAAPAEQPAGTTP